MVFPVRESRSSALTKVSLFLCVSEGRNPAGGFPLDGPLAGGRYLLPIPYGIRSSISGPTLPIADITRGPDGGSP